MGDFKQEWILVPKIGLERCLVDNQGNIVEIVSNKKANEELQRKRLETLEEQEEPKMTQQRRPELTLEQLTDIEFKQVNERKWLMTAGVDSAFTLFNFSIATTVAELVVGALEKATTGTGLFAGSFNWHYGLDASASLGATGELNSFYGRVGRTAKAVAALLFVNSIDYYFSKNYGIQDAFKSLLMYSAGGLFAYWYESSSMAPAYNSFFEVDTYVPGLDDAKELEKFFDRRSSRVDGVRSSGTTVAIYKGTGPNGKDIYKVRGEFNGMERVIPKLAQDFQIELGAKKTAGELIDFRVGNLGIYIRETEGTVLPFKKPAGAIPRSGSRVA